MVTKEPIRVLLVQDQAVVRAGLRMLIDSWPGLKVVGEAGEIGPALAIAARERPDIVVLDADHGKEGLLDIVSKLASFESRIRVGRKGMRGQEQGANGRDENKPLHVAVLCWLTKSANWSGGRPVARAS